jgi:hypothetical protein
MKKYLLTTFVLMIAVSFLAQAQDDLVIKGSKQMNKKMTPQQVIDSLNKRFPDAESVKYFKAPSDVVQQGWTVTEDDNLTSGDEIDYYTITFKQKGMDYYGLYDKDGNLLQLRVEETSATLPEPIQNSIKLLSQSHPGYKIVSKNYYKNQNYNKNKEYYEIIAEKDKVRKRLYYLPDGTLIKIKG